MEVSSGSEKGHTAASETKISPVLQSIQFNYEKSCKYTLPGQHRAGSHQHRLVAEQDPKGAQT